MSILTPSVWRRLLKGAPEATKPLKPKAVEHHRRRWRLMDILVAFGAKDQAATMLHPRRERPR